MKFLKIGILCPSEIAYRRFMPALKKTDFFEYAGIAIASKDEWFGNVPSETILIAEKSKAKKFQEAHGGVIFDSYGALLSDKAIECVYIPLPPGLHYPWAKAALENGKHVLVEKPCTDKFEKTLALIKIAKERELALHENYMFQFHSQIAYILNEIENIGEIRLIKIDFGFPFKGAQDFRYNKALGGGALLDCGGYTIKLAGVFLGESARIVYSDLHGKEGFEVDIYGNAVIVNDAGRVVYLAFGMDNSYKCSLEIWGSNGTLYTNRVFTAPDGFIPIVEETDAAGNHKTEISLAADDSFRKSIEYFYGCINDTNKRLNAYKDITKQAGLVEEVGKCFK